MNRRGKSVHRLRRLVVFPVVGLALVYLLLLIPSPYPAVTGEGKKQPFIWDQDRMWSALENQFAMARQAGCEKIGPLIDSSLVYLDSLLETMAADTLSPDDSLFSKLEEAMFYAAPKIAACSERLSDYIGLYARLREVVKRQSSWWEMSSPNVRARVYRLLYGGRAAVEEVMLQAPRGTVPSLILGHNEPSATPAAELLNVTVHSGDILVSRGGAPTSALIARGNDFPGNFSHVALAYVDEDTGELAIIESHIECGVTISSVDDYLSDTKLRVMVLRLRADQPRAVADPLLPHQAARLALLRAREEHIPYDFAMDFQDPAELFCSEVVSTPYRELGVELWMGISHISSPGLRSWLAGFGVSHFVTQEPADLEYDPQLCVVAEWHDPQRLYQDHIDNAVIDAMLETADARPQLKYSWYMLPVARLGKAYSVMLNLIGEVGPVPEGMSAATALRNVSFSAKHQAIKTRLLSLAENFRRQRGYTPPYWELVRMAQQAQTDLE